MKVTVSRRDMIWGLGLLGVSSAKSFPALAENRELAEINSPSENLKHLLRMSASLDPEDCPWYYNGTIFAVIGEKAPVPIMNFQGMEIYWVEKLEEGKYWFTGNTVSFMTDTQNGEWLREMRNPFTGKTLEVPAAVQGGRPDRGFYYSVDGVEPSWAADKIEDKPLKLWWTQAGDFIWLHNETVYPPGMPQPRKQRQTTFANLKDFKNSKIRKISSAFSSTFFSPWPSWMKMDDRPGHVIWHASGIKLGSTDELPANYKKRIMEI